MPDGMGARRAGRLAPCRSTRPPSPSLPSRQGQGRGGGRSDDEIASLPPLDGIGHPHPCDRSNWRSRSGPRRGAGSCCVPRPQRRECDATSWEAQRFCHAMRRQGSVSCHCTFYAPMLRGEAPAQELTGMPRSEDPRDLAPNASQPSIRHVTRKKTTTATNLPPLPGIDSDQPPQKPGGTAQPSAPSSRAGRLAQRGPAGPRCRRRRWWRHPSSIRGERPESGPASTGSHNREY